STLIVHTPPLTFFISYAYIIMEILEKIKRFLKNFLKNFWKALTRLKGQKKRGVLTHPSPRRYTPCTDPRISQRPPCTYRRGDTLPLRRSLYARLPFRRCGTSYSPLLLCGMIYYIIDRRKTLMFFVKFFQKFHEKYLIFLARYTII